MWLEYVGVAAVGELEWVEGVAWLLGEETEEWVGIEAGSIEIPVSILGAILEVDRRLWCLFISVRFNAGGCTIF